MRSPRFRTLRGDEEGVASTVGTIMALLVVLTLLTLVVNQYVPVWGKENEAAHEATVYGQFGALKGTVDTQIIAARSAMLAGSTFIPTESYTAIQLGTEGLPVFSGPTIGQLTGSGDGALWSVQFQYAIDSNVYSVRQSGGGNIVLDVHNRYHVPYSLAYEGGAVIMSQSVGQAIRVEPQFIVLNATTGVEVAFTMVHLLGSGNVADSGTEGVLTKLLTLDPDVYTNPRGNLWINHTTDFGPAWFQYLNLTLSLAFAIIDADFGQPGYTYFEVPSGQSVVTPYYSLSRFASGDTHNVTLEIVHNPLGGRPITKITLDQAFVNIAIGARGATLEV